MSATRPARRFHRRLAAGAVAVLCIGAAQAQAASVACFAGTDVKQAHLRELQQDFTVAALSCGASAVPSASFTDRYNAFIGKFAAVLRDNARVLEAHFVGHGGTSGFDSWMTKLANAAAVRAATEPTYCDHARASLELAVAVEPAGIADFAMLNTESNALVAPCREQRRAAKPAVVKPAAKPDAVVGMAGGQQAVTGN